MRLPLFVALPRLFRPSLPSRHRVSIGLVMVPSFARRRSSAQDWSLLSPHDEIETFLAGSVADPKLSFDVALIFARNMAQELRVVLSEWEDVVNVLERVKANVASETNN